MLIRFHGEDDLEQALREIHRLANAYEGPLMREFMELAKLSAPVDREEPLDNVPDVGNVMPAHQRETKERFEEALSLLMVLAFPMDSGTEKAVRGELNEILGRNQNIESMQMRVGNRKSSLRSNLGRRPTRQQAALRQALLDFLPPQPQRDL